MAEEITPAPQSEIENTTSVAESTGGFAPQISTHPVAGLTLGSQNFNDSDKSNYFEG